MPSEGRPAAEKVLDALKAEIDCGRIDIFQNLLGKPYISLRLPEHPWGTFFLLHKDVRGWLAVFAWEGGHGFLKERDIDRILTFFRGLALRKRLLGISDPALLKLLRTEPVLAVAYEFMCEKETGKHEATMANLWKAWREHAVERGLLFSGRRRFPGGPQVLSRLITHFRDVLLALGIKVEMKRSNGSQITLTRTDASAEQSSSESSVLNPGLEYHLEAEDASRSAQLARLRARQRPKDPKERGGDQM